MFFSGLLLTTFNDQLLFSFSTVLRGYMVAKDGSACIATSSATAVADSSGVTADAAGLSVGCTLMSVQDGDRDGMLL